jgi:hypothetical protein
VTARAGWHGDGLAEAAREPRPGAVASPARRASIREEEATYLRCGGCGTSAVFGQHEPHYGELVHEFLDRHEPCGGAVEITRAARGGSRGAQAAT